MDFELSDRCVEYQGRLQEFMDERVYPAEAVYEEQMAAADSPNHQRSAASGSGRCVIARIPFL